MKNVIILLGLVAINSALRVPTTWNELHPTTVTVKSYKELRPRRGGGVPYQPENGNSHRFVPGQQRWNPQLVRSSKNKYLLTKPESYKKPIQPKKKKLLYKQFNPSNYKENYKYIAPYITYKKPNNTLDVTLFIPTRPLTAFTNVYPKIQKPKNRKPQQSQPFYQKIKQNVAPFDNNFNIPFKTKPDSEFIPSIQTATFPLNNNEPNSGFVPILPRSNNFNNYEPNQKIVNYFDSVKNENFIPNRILTEDKVVKPISEDQNNYQSYHELKKNPIEQHTPENHLRHFSHLYKNYRDDESFEPQTDDHPEYIKEENPVFQREELENIPPSSHEIPKEVPTKPIYPGEGLWANPSLKYKPFVSQQTYDTLKEDDIKPDGYDTFIEGQKSFNLTNDRLTDRFRSFPDQHELNSFIEQKHVGLNEKKKANEDAKDKSQEDENEESEEEEFVPTRLYAQVRANEDTEYLPQDEADDGKLREAIKESKIHTVYTEEGYEDSAYDHVGHEKEAENDEGFEDLQREKLEKKEKKVPKAKLNLHTPNFKRTKFSHGEELLTDEEIEEIKQKELGLEDNDAEGSHVEEFPIENDENYEENKEPSAPKIIKNNNNNFISTKETKTMTTKETNDGDTETQISSKVNIIMQPYNSTKSQKYTKIYPKVYKTIRRTKPPLENEPKHLTNTEDKPVNFSGIYIEEIIPTTELPFTKLPSRDDQDLNEEIPITTLPTTAIPNPIKPKIPNNAEEALENITKEFFKINKKRVKRFTNDFSDLKIEKEFVPKISHELGKKNDYKKNKYPYYENYKQEDINIDSPLRYSQNMKDIPIKTGKKMVFYEEADKRKPCPKIEASLNPIPERVLNAEKKNPEKNPNLSDKIDDEGEENDNEDLKRRKREVESNNPRLAGLGQQIDCLKARYFGDNPLDSPFFDEVTVGTIEPIFKELKKNGYNEETSEQYDNDVNNKIKVKKQVYNNYEDNQFGKKIVSKTKETSIASDKQKEQKIINNKNIKHSLKSLNNIETTTRSTPIKVTVPTISLLTTPEYTISLKPKHIYDQIELLEYLPHEVILNTNQSSTNVVLNSPSSNSREDKALDEDNLTYESSDDNPMLPEAEELKRRKKIRRRRPPFQIFDVNKFLPTTPSPIYNNPPVAFPVEKQKTSTLQIFDINKFIPTTTSFYREVVTPSTVLPKYKIVSEVFYKDDIKPYEQLNVFNDVLNNIKNSSRQEMDTSIESSEPVSVTLDSKKHIESSKKYYPAISYQDSYLKAYGDQEIDINYSAPIATTIHTPAATTTTTHRPTTYRGRFRFKAKANHEKPAASEDNFVKNKDFEEKLKLYLALQEAKRKQKYVPVNSNVGYAHLQPAKNNEDNGHTIPVNEDIDDYVDKTTKVVGLMPPGTSHYKTIHHPKRDSNIQMSNPQHMNKRVNKFFVVGMKPPPHQKVLVYSDFLNKHLVTKKMHLRRGKRSSGSYSSLSRNRGQQESELEEATVLDNDDDYVPHRPKNYYYDEKTGKIIYLTTDKPNQEEDNEEVEYEEIIEEPPATTSKPKQNPIFATATPPPEGKGYVDYILKLKQHPNYKYIPDPTTTERILEPNTEKTTTTTLKPLSTTPPEFLNILAKVRQNNNYKQIEDEKVKKEIKTTQSPEETVNEEEEFADDEEDASAGDIRNSPGGQIRDASEYFGIFDVTDFIPKIKNYLPKTSYDTSKYKTIKRPTAKPTTDDEVENEPEEQHSTEKYIIQERTTQKRLTTTPEEIHLNLDNLNEATITKETEEIPITTVKRRRPTTTTSTTTTTETPSTRSAFLRRKRPTILRSTRTTTSRPSTTVPPSTISTVTVSHQESIRRVFRRRPSTTTKYLNEEQEDTTRVLRRRSGTREPGSTESPTTHKSTFIETFKKFHRNKKHGGSYRTDNVPSEQTRTAKEVAPSPEAVSDIPINKDVEVIGEFDKTKRHGGNYRKIEESKEDNGEKEVEYQDYDDKSVEDVTEANGKSLRINLLQNQEEVEEREEPLENPSNDEYRQKEPAIDKKNNKKKSDKNSKGKYVTEPSLLRLTDVVPKPDSFYSDPTLPRSVNLLAAVNKLSSAEVGDFLSSADTSEVNLNKDENVDVDTKKPLIIKDPSKRFYYYAPI